MHLALKPLPGVDLAIWPAVNALTADLVLDELALVHASVHDLEDALAFFHAVFELPLIYGSVRPLLNSGAMLLVVHPVALVTSAIWFDTDALSLHLVRNPHSLQ